MHLADTTVFCHFLTILHFLTIFSFVFYFHLLLSLVIKNYLVGFRHKDILRVRTLTFYILSSTLYFSCINLWWRYKCMKFLGVNFNLILSLLNQHTDTQDLLCCSFGYLIPDKIQSNNLTPFVCLGRLWLRW